MLFKDFSDHYTDEYALGKSVKTNIYNYFGNLKKDERNLMKINLALTLCFINDIINLAFYSDFL